MALTCCQSSLQSIYEIVYAAYIKFASDLYNMAEVVGLVASVVAITAAVIKAVRIVKACYRASEELGALEASSNMSALL
jgi:hypothetical protein